ncbi:MAG: alpha/beta fold hydrolase, partial [Oscillospiraceae bacterium]|nr:alpha/beta fold hydrolase [Oscillospiraceae bacterium]
FHVLVFHYSGSWGSDGTYSLAHVLEDSHTALDYLLREAPFGVDRARIYVAGHSLGGFAAAHLLAERPEIRAGALLMPCDIGRLPVIAEEDPAAFRTIRQILEDSGPWLTGTSGEALWREAEADSDALRLESLAAQLAEKPLLCVRGSLDTDTPPEQHCDPLLRCIRAAGGTRVQTVTLPTDHLSADHRLALAGAVTGFFTGQERENQNSFPADS